MTKRQRQNDTGLQGPKVALVAIRYEQTLVARHGDAGKGFAVVASLSEVVHYRFVYKILIEVMDVYF